VERSGEGLDQAGIEGIHGGGQFDHRPLWDYDLFRHTAIDRSTDPTMGGSLAEVVGVAETLLAATTGDDRFDGHEPVVIGVPCELVSERYRYRAPPGVRHVRTADAR
jgi:hypothetical protein